MSMNLIDLRDALNSALNEGSWSGDFEVIYVKDANLIDLNAQEFPISAVIKLSLSNGDGAVILSGTEPQI